MGRFKNCPSQKTQRKSVPTMAKNQVIPARRYNVVLVANVLAILLIKRHAQNHSDYGNTLLTPPLPTKPNAFLFKGKRPSFTKPNAFLLKGKALLLRNPTHFSSREKHFFYETQRISLQRKKAFFYETQRISPQGKSTSFTKPNANLFKGKRPSWGNDQRALSKTAALGSVLATLFLRNFISIRYIG